MPQLRREHTGLDTSNRERSAALRREADDLLTDTGIDVLLQRYGDVLYVGGYALDLMAWSDIDISVVPAEGQSVRGFMALCTDIAEVPSVTRLHFQNFLVERPAHFPPGLYAGIRVRREVLWKVDLWSVDRSEVLERQRDVTSILDRLDDEARTAIIDAKFALLTGEGRTPDGSGLLIYEAVLSEGLKEIEEIRGYLRAQGIEV